MDISVQGGSLKKRREGFSYSAFLRHSVTGAAIGLFAAVILIFIAAIFINGFAPDPGALTDIAVAAAAALGAIAGGYFSARAGGSYGLFHGFAAGAIMSLALFFASLFASGAGGGSPALRIVLVAAQLLAASVGGIIAGNRSYKKSARSPGGRKKR